MNIQDIILSPEERKQFAKSVWEQGQTYPDYLANQATLKALRVIKDTIHDIMVNPTSAGRKLYEFDDLEETLKALIKSLEVKE